VPSPDAMRSFTLLFVALLVSGLAIELWLLLRQARVVRAQRERVPAPFAAVVRPEEHARAADYTIAKSRLAMFERASGATLVAALTLGGGVAALNAWSVRVLPAGLAADLGTVVAVLVVVTLAGLPFDAWRTFRIESRFGFNRTTPTLFLADAARELAIGACLLLPLVALLLWMMPRTGPQWWLWAWAAWALFAVLLGWAWPRVIAPIFNRFRELEAGSLRDDVESLARRCGFEPRGVFVMDGSRRSTHGNAYFTGLGRTKRIVFFDTLLESLAPAEVQAVLAHELGHFRLHHVALGIALSLAGALAGFALMGWLVDETWFQPALGVTRGGPHTFLILCALAAPAFVLPLRPLLAALSRHHEYAADRFATAHADAGALADALVKLHRENASTLTPDALYTAFHASHPPPLARIARLAPNRFG
jgi:STE24 endopeptidase